MKRAFCNDKQFYILYKQLDLLLLSNLYNMILYKLLYL